MRKGDSWVLNGNKTFITNGQYAEIAVVIAVTDRDRDTHGLSAFVVEKGTKGFRSGKKENKLGLRASDTSEMIFEDCEIPLENLLGMEGNGFIDAMRVLDGGRISIAALSTGHGARRLRGRSQILQERKQFGKAISEFQGIQWKLADMATEMDAAVCSPSRRMYERYRHEDNAGIVDGQALCQRSRRALRMKRYRFTAAMASSKIIR